MKVKIWGARGSIPSPIRPDEIREKIIAAILGISQIEKGELKEELLAAIMEESPAPSEISSGQSVNLALAKTQVKRRQVVRAYLDTLSPLVAGTAGGNTPCIEVQSGDDLFIIDAGSGIRALGLELMKGKCGQGRGTIHLFFSHPHWDHIQGFPFFRPAFVRGNKIFIYGLHDMEAALRRQQEFISFPVSLDYMQAELKFIRLKPEDSLEFGDLRIRTLRNHHPGDAYAFRFEKADKVFVYASDAAYPSGTDTHPALNFFADADMLIYDSQFTQKESDEKEDWGHSSSLAGVEMAQEANVRNLVLFHYDPTYTDRDLEKF
ncbi:MAG: MBL fold metallo-hydrolase [Anaerolineales bacterium]|nr:MBL fold metallo-hydrolase [Anaerolineales bacterium]